MSSLGDEILERAKRIVRLEEQLRQERVEYRQLVEKLASVPSAAQGQGDSVVGQAPLRHRILRFLSGQRNPVNLHRVQSATGEPRDRVIWTLANLKRAGHVLNPRRGYWQINPDGKEGPEVGREPEIGKRFEPPWTAADE